MTKEELKQKIIKALKEIQDYEWLHAHNGKAKYVYLQTVIDIVIEQFELASAEPREKRIADLEKENAELKILVSSMLYEINALWDISEMNEDVRKHAERIDSKVEK